jgi:hypothetical protein
MVPVGVSRSTKSSFRSILSPFQNPSALLAILVCADVMCQPVYDHGDGQRARKQKNPCYGQNFIQPGAGTVLVIGIQPEWLRFRIMSYPVSANQADSVAGPS